MNRRTAPQSFWFLGLTLDTLKPAGTPPLWIFDPALGSGWEF
jgi:hypothetical protein